MRFFWHQKHCGVVVSSFSQQILPPLNEPCVSLVGYDFGITIIRFPQNPTHQREHRVLRIESSGISEFEIRLSSNGYFAYCCFMNLHHLYW